MKYKLKPTCHCKTYPLTKWLLVFAPFKSGVPPVFADSFHQISTAKSVEKLAPFFWEDLLEVFDRLLPRNISILEPGFWVQSPKEKCNTGEVWQWLT